MGYFRFLTQHLEEQLRHVQLSVEDSVVVVRVMMSDKPTGNRGEFNEEAGVGDGGMPPTYPCWLLLHRILCFVNENIDVRQEVD